MVRSVDVRSRIPPGPLLRRMGDAQGPAGNRPWSRSGRGRHRRQHLSGVQPGGPDDRTSSQAPTSSPTRPPIRAPSGPGCCPAANPVESPEGVRRVSRRVGPRGSRTWWIGTRSRSSFPMSTPRTGFRHDLGRLADLWRTGRMRLPDGRRGPVGRRSSHRRGRLTGVDFMSGTLMKWLLGPPGLGFLYARRELVETLPPPHVGYVGSYWNEGSGWCRKPGFPLGGRPPRDRPGRPPGDGGSSSGGWTSSSRQTSRPSSSHILDLTGQIIEGLTERGDRGVDPGRAGSTAGQEWWPSTFAGAVPLCRYLRKRRGWTSWGYPEDERVRADPHLYNTPDDVDRLLAGIDEYCRQA